jgi:hypothetical protein
MGRHPKTFTGTDSCTAANSLFYSIASSARESSVVGMSIPSGFQLNLAIAANMMRFRNCLPPERRVRWRPGLKVGAHAAAGQS